MCEQGCPGMEPKPKKMKRKPRKLEAFIVVVDPKECGSFSDGHMSAKGALEQIKGVKTVFSFDDIQSMSSSVLGGVRETLKTLQGVFKSIHPKKIEELLSGKMEDECPDCGDEMIKDDFKDKYFCDNADCEGRIY